MLIKANAGPAAETAPTGFHEADAPLAYRASRPMRIAQMLDLAEPSGMTEVRLARVVGDGLGVEAVDSLDQWLRRTHGIRELVPEATLRRARTAGKRLSRDHSERVYEVTRVIETALRAYHDDEEAAMEFLSRRHWLLDMERPLDLAQVSSAGADAVIALIERAQAGGAV